MISYTVVGFIIKVDLSCSQLDLKGGDSSQGSFHQQLQPGPASGWQSVQRPVRTLCRKPYQVSTWLIHHFSVNFTLLDRLLGLEATVEEVIWHIHKPQHSTWGCYLGCNCSEKVPKEPSKTRTPTPRWSPRLLESGLQVRTPQKHGECLKSPARKPPKMGS